VSADSCCDVGGDCCAGDCEGETDCIYGNKRFFGSAEYLLWWVKDSPTSALVTNGSTSSNVLGSSDSGSSTHSGGRIAAGYWFTDNHIIGVDAGATYLNLGTKGNDVGDTGGSNCLAIADVGLRSKVLCGEGYRLEVLGGFRYLGLYDSLFISDVTGNPPPGDFQACNSFFGGNIGLHATFKINKFIIDLTGKCGLGSMVQTVKFNDKEIGVSSADKDKKHSSRFAVIPEATATVGYQVTDWWRVQVGYSFLYANKVVRAGDQVRPTNGNPNLTTPPTQKNYSDFWAQGINFGMEFRF
jgi:hypothetical protein